MPNASAGAVQDEEAAAGAVGEGVLGDELGGKRIVEVGGVHECGMWNAEWKGALLSVDRASIPHSAFRIPHCSAVKHRRLVRVPGRCKAEVPVRGPRGAPPPWRPGQE